MNSIKRIFTQPAEISFLLISILAAAIPFGFKVAYTVVPIVVVILFAAWKDFRLQTVIHREMYYMIAIFAVYLIWSVPAYLFYGSASFIEKVLPLIAFPVAVGLSAFDEGVARKVSVIFILAVVASYTVSLGQAIYNYHYVTAPWYRQSDFFFHEQFTKGVFDIHPTYYSLMGNVATILAFHVLRKGWKFFFVTILTVFVILINAKITLLLHVCIILFKLIQSVVNDLNWKRILVGVGSVLLIIGLMKITANVYDYKHRQLNIDLGAAWERSYSPDIYDGVDGGIVVRMAIWRNAVHVVTENPLFGVGFGMETEALINEYKKQSFQSLVDLQYNAHNQVLSYLVSFGIVGCVLIFTLVFLCVKKGIRDHNWLHIEFLAILLVCCMTESLLNRLNGIAIFAFFNAFFLLRYSHDKTI